MSGNRYAELRARALQVLEQRQGSDGATAILQEMDVLQAELEVQQEELRDSQRRASELAAYYQQLFFDSPLALVVLGAGQKLRELNLRARALLGIDSEGVPAVTFDRYVSALDHRTWEELLGSDDLSVRGVELTLRRAGGELRRCVCTLRRRSDSEVLVSLDDITQLRSTEEQKRIAAERLAQLLHDSRDGVVFVDQGTGLVTEVNDALTRLLGYSVAQLVGRPLTSLFDPEDSLRQELTLKRAVNDPPVAPLLLRFRRSSAVPVDTEVTLGKLREGSRAFITMLVRDVSERLRLEAEREQLTRVQAQTQRLEALGQLAAGVAHDMNNVLMAILACASPAEGAAADEVAAALEDIRKAATRGRELTGRLSSLGRKDPVRVQRFDLLRSLKEVTGLLRRTLGPAIDIELSHPPGDFFIEGDEGAWHQAFLNLGINARDAMPHGGQLKLEARLTPAGLAVTVRDNGVGMTPAVAERAFEPFFTTKPPGQGTGLGLAHVHAVARAHHVTVRLESAPGNGTAFHFDFTRLEDAGAPAPAAQAQPTPPPSSRCLVVDDDDLVRRGLRRALQRLGMSVLEANGGPATLELLDNGAKVDLVLTDLSMPGMTGEELAAELRRRHPTLPVLVVTGDVDELRRERLRKAGIPVLAKPFQLNELIDALGRLHRESSGATA